MNVNELLELAKDDPSVLYETIKNNPTILPKALDLITYRSEIIDVIEIYFEELPNPSIYYLEKFLNHPQNKNSCKHLHIKHQALTSTPSLIEKTMTPYQLYQSKNILYAKTFPARTIQYISEAEKKLKHITEKDFNEICNCTYYITFYNFIEKKTHS